MTLCLYSALSCGMLRRQSVQLNLKQRVPGKLMESVRLSILLPCCLQSVIKRSLKERQEILKRAIHPVPPSGHPLNNLWAALVVQAPGEKVLDHDEPFCRIGHTVADIHAGYENALRLGVSAGGPWQPHCLPGGLSRPQTALTHPTVGQWHSQLVSGMDDSLGL